MTETTSPSEIPRWDSQELLQGHSRVVIVHDGVAYTLSVTRQGKLILTK